MVKLNNDQKNEIIRLYKAGYAVKEIAAKTELSYNNVRYTLKTLRKKGIEVKRWWE